MNASVSVEVGESRVAFGGKTYELSLTRNYVSRWGVPQAIRELIQNALDSESPFVYEFAQGEDPTIFTLLLTSEFTVLEPRTLLLGATSKADSKDSIGSFGEGFKIALLVLTRMGYDAEMRNGSVLWRPRFRHNSKFGEELLVIDETELPDRRNKGLTVAVKGLTEGDVDDIRGSCLRMQKDIGQIHATMYGDILLERAGLLYVGGLFVCKTDMNYGYNIKPEHLKLERDRQTVDNFDLQMLTKEMWFATGLHDHIASLIDAKMPDVEYAKYSSPELVKDACYRLFKSRNPNAIAVASNEELKQLVERGMTSVVVLNDNMYANVRGSSGYRAATFVRVDSPTERLEKWFAEARFHIHEKHRASFRALVEESRRWTLKP